jgi:hypothetical protein
MHGQKGRQITHLNDFQSCRADYGYGIYREIVFVRLHARIRTTSPPARGERVSVLVRFLKQAVPRNSA